MDKLKEILFGIIIGSAIVLPGVSGSVLMIMLGLYDKVIYLINDKNKSIVNKLAELMPLIIGIIMGVVSFGNILLIFYTKYDVLLIFIFIGLILGGIPILTKEIKDHYENINYKYLIITLIISSVLFILNSFKVNNNININNISIISLFFAGIFYISGKIIPGISSSFFLIIFNIYDYILKIIANPFSISFNEYLKLLPFILGVVVGFIILIKLINYLLLNHHEKTYSIIIGFVLGSIFAIYPGINLSVEYIFGVLLMLISYYFTYKISKN